MHGSVPSFFLLVPYLLLLLLHHLDAEQVYSVGIVMRRLIQCISHQFYRISRVQSLNA